MGVGCFVWHMQFERRCPETQKIVTLGQKIVLVEAINKGVVPRVWDTANEGLQGAPTLKVDWRKARFVREGLEPFDGSALVSWAISGPG